MYIDMPALRSRWTPTAPAASWAARLVDARAALDAAHIDLASSSDGADWPDPGEGERAALVAAYRATFGL